MEGIILHFHTFGVDMTEAPTVCILIRKAANVCKGLRKIVVMDEKNKACL